MGNDGPMTINRRRASSCLGALTLGVLNLPLAAQNSNVNSADSRKDSGKDSSTDGINAARQVELTAEQARRDWAILRRAFTDLHPGLYNFITPAQLEAAFAAANEAVAQGASRAQMVWWASILAATVRCGHTWASHYNQRDDVVRTVFQRADKLPFTLRWVGARALVTASADAAVMPSTELRAINGRAMVDISHALLPALRADGSSDGKRWSQLDSGPHGGAMDRLFPLWLPPHLGRYHLTLHDGTAQREIEAATLSQAARDKALPNPATDWHFQINGDIGVITTPTFAFRRGQFDYKEFLADAFKRLQSVPFLVIDQRRNEGGDDALGRALLSYLLRQPYTEPATRVESAFERVPYLLARYLDTWDFDFFDRTGLAKRGPGRNWLMPDKPPRRVMPVASPYAGQTWLLMGAQNSSAGFLFARNVKASGAATLVGQPSGGNLRGLNGGQLAWVTLPNSGVAVDIPLLAHVILNNPPDSGVLPDVAVKPNWDAAKAGLDSEMAVVHRLIAAKRPNATANIPAWNTARPG